MTGPLLQCIRLDATLQLSTTPPDDDDHRGDESSLGDGDGDGDGDVVSPGYLVASEIPYLVKSLPKPPLLQLLSCWFSTSR